MTEISIGQQSGGPVDGVMWPKVHLYVMLAKHCTKTYCPAIDQFSLVLRVSGRFTDFGPEAIERIRRRRKARYVTADIVVSVHRWQRKTEIQLKKYLTAQVRRGLELLVARLKKDKERGPLVTQVLDGNDSGKEKLLAASWRKLFRPRWIVCLLTIGVLVLVVVGPPWYFGWRRHKDVGERTEAAALMMRYLAQHIMGGRMPDSWEELHDPQRQPYSLGRKSQR